jgi:tRNA threonylcarbamoyladenosine modification (KEOPS) complex  Pcc1 subunit
MVMIEIEAQDIVALRATANSYLRALQVFESIKQG